MLKQLEQPSRGRSNAPARMRRTHQLVGELGVRLRDHDEPRAECSRDEARRIVEQACSGGEPDSEARGIAIGIMLNQSSVLRPKHEEPHRHKRASRDGQHGEERRRRHTEPAHDDHDHR
jgi:hypothetical protein